jgi:hypothetical protein
MDALKACGFFGTALKYFLSSYQEKLVFELLSFWCGYPGFDAFSRRFGGVLTSANRRGFFLIWFRHALMLWSCCTTDYFVKVRAGLILTSDMS